MAIPSRAEDWEIKIKNQVNIITPLAFVLWQPSLLGEWGGRSGVPSTLEGEKNKVAIPSSNRLEIFVYCGLHSSSFFPYVIVLLKAYFARPSISLSFPLAKEAFTREK